jgi:hypothetical protein
MAYEAPMEAWFTPSECVPEVSQLGIHGLERVKERRAGLREAEATTNRDVCCRPGEREWRSLGLTTLPMESAEADGRKRLRNRSTVVVRVPRGGSHMASFMSAAA